MSKLPRYYGGELAWGWSCIQKTKHCHPAGSVVTIQGRFRPWYRGDFPNTLPKTLQLCSIKSRRSLFKETVLEFAVFVVSKSCISAAISCQVCDQKILVLGGAKFHHISHHAEATSHIDLIAKRMICSIGGSTCWGEGDFFSFVLYFDVYSWLREMV